MSFIEPSYPIIKREKFDEDVMKPILSDSRFNKKDRERLSYYNKHRIGGSTINVSYRFGAGCDEARLGRLFPEDGVGLQSFRFDMRNPLAEKWYWDTDVENAHYIIANKFCEDLPSANKYIKYYIENREECLSLVSSSRKKAKTEFLKILYGGNIKLYNEHFEEVQGSITQEGSILLENIRKEVQTLMTLIWDKYPQYHKLKTGGNKIPIVKKPNAKASLMSLLFQTEERKILLTWDEFLKSKGRYLAVFIHDGGLVEKLEGETSFPKELLEKGSFYIFDKLGYRVKLTEKKLKHEWTPYTPEETQYAIMKREFEESVFMVGSHFCCKLANGEFDYLKIGDLKVKYGNRFYNMWDEETQKIKKTKFINSWLEDPQRLQYDCMDFYPARDKCPPNVYNLFEGFGAEKYECEIDDIDIEEYITPIVQHLDLLTSNNSGWFLKWLANIVQYPNMKSEIAQVIRDQGDFLREGGGTGKNIFFEWFGNEIIGEKYFIVVGNNNELYDNFNSLFESKLLIFVEEANSKDNHSHNDFLKSKITGKKININKKGINQYKTNDYSRYVFSSNNKNPLPIKQGDRRFAVFDANNSKRGNVEYFSKLVHFLNLDKTKWIFYTYLKNLETYSSPIQFQKNIPITQAYRDVRFLNAPLYHKWIINCLHSGNLKNGSVNNLYKNYTQWIENNKETKGIPLTLTAFGLLLKSSVNLSHSDYDIGTQGTKYKNREGSMFMVWNIETLIKGLKSLYLIEEDFEYINGNNGNEMTEGTEGTEG